ncbi:MAG: hypothetical protein OSJ70_06920 [Bacilli bacterium]|nr:hypothetical protein [Bacilli bacterium]
MQIVKKSEAEYYTGNGYYGYDYPTVDPDINFAVISISTRSPEAGYQVNRGCKELLYIIKGSGNLYKKDSNDVLSFTEGDVIFIDKDELYAFDGNFEAAVPCTPAWTSEQHEYVEE